MLHAEWGDVNTSEPGRAEGAWYNGEGHLTLR
jgi:hypothetical protein